MNLKNLIDLAMFNNIWHSIINYFNINNIDYTNYGSLIVAILCFIFAYKIAKSVIFYALVVIGLLALFYSGTLQSLLLMFLGM